MKRIKIWEAQSRLFHWFFALSLVAAVITSDIQTDLGLPSVFSDSWLGLHVAAGTAAGTLLVFRVFWGVYGGTYSRFREFPLAPARLYAYIRAVFRNEKVHYAGHNPGAAWYAVTIFVLCGLTAVSGVLLYGTEEGRGVLSGLKPLLFPYVDEIHELHEVLALLTILAPLAHFAGLVIETRRAGLGLVKSMITGWKEVREEHGPPQHTGGVLKTVSYVLLFFPLVLAGYVYVAAYSFVPAARVLPDFYVSECGDCHNVFSPGLLPASSWKAVIAGLEDHFDEDASLDEETTSRILEYLLANSAEHSSTEASAKILASLKGAAEPPIRITETPYWVRKHEDIGDDVFDREKVGSRANCKACHRRAESGSFEDTDISVPR